ncbi:hypothetical protein MF672_049655 [Actinomadura sp. ATCC 31491]|uniref:Uncharacterized protein n=1 Tax=Actinomadura luzonensis TaxID=2805427 RepID=A0ABT0GB57_9ACTN|nr:hypothetical protein [Actinomadura luzonensis]MCK2221822.1 hypothetical protein [Actinomadura luzonensis]
MLVRTPYGKDRPDARGLARTLARRGMQVAGGAFPRFARNHGTGEGVARAVRTQVTRFEVFHDPGRPSFLTLPVFGG